jgi:YVTN family beta-propeller protein
VAGVPHPNAVDFNPTGTRAYITSGTQPGTVKVLDTTTYEVLKTFPVGNEPLDILVNYTGKWVGVTNYSSDFVSFIDTTTDKITTLKVGPNPRGLAWVR